MNTIYYFNYRIRSSSETLVTRGWSLVFRTDQFGSDLSQIRSDPKFVKSDPNLIWSVRIWFFWIRIWSKFEFIRIWSDPNSSLFKSDPNLNWIRSDLIWFESETRSDISSHLIWLVGLKNFFLKKKIKKNYFFFRNWTERTNKPNERDLTNERM